MLRCKAGDLALVMHDEDSCADNIGKLVRVGGPVNVNGYYGMPCWLIEPVKPEAWFLIPRRDGEPRSKVISFADRVDHPDAWLLPLRPQRQEGSIVRRRKRLDVGKLGAGCKPIPEKQL